MRPMSAVVLPPLAFFSDPVASDGQGMFPGTTSFLATYVDGFAHRVPTVM